MCSYNVYCKLEKETANSNKSKKVNSIKRGFNIFVPLCLLIYLNYLGDLPRKGTNNFYLEKINFYPAKL